MLPAVFLSLGFFFTSLIAVTVVPSLPAPLAYTPLVMITGLLTMHRVGVGPGVAWLALGGLFLSFTGIAPGAFVPHVVSALVAVLLVERVFATRSVYALLGLGLVTGLCTLVVDLIVQGIGSIFDDAPRSFTGLLSHNLWTLLLLILGLYAGFVIVVAFRTWTRRTFVIR